MLVLTRRVGEEIIIAGEIRLHVLGVQGRRVRLGILAPQATRVMRAELLGPRPAESVAVRGKMQK
jgi:carbon storage regulator